MEASARIRILELIENADYNPLLEDVLALVLYEKMVYSTDPMEKWVLLFTIINGLKQCGIKLPGEREYQKTLLKAEENWKKFCIGF